MAGLVFSEVIKDRLNKDQLESLKTSYLDTLENYPFLLIEDWSYQSVIKELKRDLKKRIGPYTDITVFEAANRIATDLTMMDGILKLFSDGKLEIQETVKIRLGTMYISGRGDFTVFRKDESEQEGESFNVAASFFQSKMQKTLKKWENESSLKYILFNKDCLSTDKLYLYFENLKKERQDIEFVLTEDVSGGSNIRKKNKRRTFADLSPEEQKESIEMTDRMFAEVMSDEYQKEEFE